MFFLIYSLLGVWTVTKKNGNGIKYTVKRVNLLNLVLLILSIQNLRVDFW